LAPPAVLPSTSRTASAPRIHISRLDSPACTCPCPTLRHALAGRRRMARGRRGSLALRRRALSSPPPCRFIPALTRSNRTRRGRRLFLAGTGWGGGGRLGG